MAQQQGFVKQKRKMEPWHHWYQEMVPIQTPFGSSGAYFSTEKTWGAFALSRIQRHLIVLIERYDNTGAFKTKEFCVDGKRHIGMGFKSLDLSIGSDFFSKYEQYL